MLKGLFRTSQVTYRVVCNVGVLMSYVTTNPFVWSASWDVGHILAPQSYQPPPSSYWDITELLYRYTNINNAHLVEVQVYSSSLHGSSSVSKHHGEIGKIQHCMKLPRNFNSSL